MNSIMVIEDNEKLRKNLVELAMKVNPNLEVHSVGKATSAYEIAKEKNIIAFFIDIQLPDYNGILLAKKIREIKKYQFTPIVFITAIITKELEAFKELHCYDYIIKPFSVKEITLVFKNLLIDYVENTVKSNRITLEFKGFTQIIDEKDIVFIEYTNRKIVIYTVKDRIEYIHMPLIRFKSKLKSSDFIQIHQAFLVNRNYISLIDISKQIIKLKIVNKDLPIGRSYKKKIGEIIDDIY